MSNAPECSLPPCTCVGLRVCCSADPCDPCVCAQHPDDLDSLIYESLADPEYARALFAVMRDEHTAIFALYRRACDLLEQARPVLEHVSRGRGFLGVEPYPDATARRVLGAWIDADDLPIPEEHCTQHDRPMARCLALGSTHVVPLPSDHKEIP